MVIVEENPTEETLEPILEDTTEQQFETYTNEFFPDFELVYRSDWKFSTKTEIYGDTGLFKRDIFLSKDNNKVRIATQPADAAGCDNTTDDLFSISDIALNNGIQVFI